MRTATRLLAAATLVVGCTDRAGISTGPVSAPAASTITAREDGTAPRYAPRLLVSLPTERTSAALAINDSGVAVGFSVIELRVDPPDWPRDTCYGSVATVWRAGRAQSLHRELARAIGVRNFCDIASIATDINDRGQVVGAVWLIQRPDYSHGFRWTPGAGVELLQMVGPIYLSGINSAGVAVGHLHPTGFGTGGREAIVWSSTMPVTPPPSFNVRDHFLWDITDRGETAGCINYRPFYTDAAGSRIRLEDWCTVPPSLVAAYPVHIHPGRLNASGTVVFSGMNGPTIWYASQGRVTVSAGWTRGGAAGISDRGRVVGWRSDAAPPISIAMTRGPGGRVLELPGLMAGSASEAHGVNTCGTIVGVTVGTDGNPHATQWTTTRCDTR
jgi:probable HAF family extracellular repeat protein